MKMNKILAVLLSVVMLLSVIPAFSLTATAAAVGEVTNGGFEAGDGTGWTVSAYGVSFPKGYSLWGSSIGEQRSGSYCCRLSKDSSHNGNTFLTQVIPVNTNATYTFSFYSKGPKNGRCFTYSVYLGADAASCTYAVANKSTPIQSSSSYQKTEVTIQTGFYKYLKIQFIGTGSGSNDSYLDDITLDATNSGDTGTHAKPSLTGFGTEKNQPSGYGSNVNDLVNCTNNVIVQPGFEDTTNAQWNTTDFLKQGVSVVTSGGTDGDAHSGNKFLKYYHGSVAYTDWPMFEITCPTAGEYVFSAWVRTPTLSANNVGAASIGIINPDTGKFLTYGNAGGSYDGHYSNTETQLRSTATDDNWHLRSVTFYVGANNSNVKIGMYGLKSTMYVDDISVHLLSKGTKYVGNQQGTLSASTSVTNKYCESENNLVPDCNMNGDPSEEFWTIGASGWNNGFLNFQQDPQNSDHGNALHFKGTSPASNKTYRYIKFVYVEPNTSYTVSFDYRVVKNGNPLMFVDNNINKNATFHTPSLGSASNSWQTYSFTFNTGNYNRIGIVFKDGSGEAYFDDFRFFKNSDGIADEPEEEVFPTLKPDHPEKYTSRMEMEEKDGKQLYGLAFLFELQCKGVTRQDDLNAEDKFCADYTNGTVDAFDDGGEHRLITAGAVVTNDKTVGENASIFTLDNIQTDKTVIDVAAEKLFYDTDAIELNGVISYAVRVANIPENHVSTPIYVRPYYVFDYNGTEVTVYGDIVSACYETFPDINDGWMEWD